VEFYSCELPNFQLKFFAAPPPKKFGNLSEQELNQLVEERHSALGDGPKKQQTGLYQPFEITNALREF